MKGLKACTSKAVKNGIGQYYCTSKKSYTPWIIKSSNIALWGACTEKCFCFVKKKFKSIYKCSKYCLPISIRIITIHFFRCLIMVSPGGIVFSSISRIFTITTSRRGIMRTTMLMMIMHVVVHIVPAVSLHHVACAVPPSAHFLLPQVTTALVGEHHPTSCAPLYDHMAVSTVVTLLLLGMVIVAAAVGGTSS